MLSEEAAIRTDKQIPLPVHILFWVTAAFLIDGAIYEIVRAGWYLVLDHKLADNLNFLNIAFLPLGIGLIKRSPDSRSCVQTLFVLILLLFFAIAGAGIFDFGSTGFESYGRMMWALVIVFALWIIAVLWCFRRYETYFNDPELTPEARRNEKALVWLIIISGVISNLTMVASDYEFEKRLDGIFAVHLDFYAIDSETKQPIKNYLFDFDVTDSQHLSHRAGYREKEGGNFLQRGLSGFSEEPFKITFSAEGYLDYEVTVTKKFVESARELIAIQLEPADKAAPESPQTEPD